MHPTPCAEGQVFTCVECGRILKCSHGRTRIGMNEVCLGCYPKLGQDRLRELLETKFIPKPIEPDSTSLPIIKAKKTKDSGLERQDLIKKARELIPGMTTRQLEKFINAFK